jgi:hypothetical protein
MGGGTVTGGLGEVGISTGAGSGLPVGPLTTAVGRDVAEVVPQAFVARTVTRSRRPMSEAVSSYVRAAYGRAPLRPPTTLQRVPLALHCSQR